MISTSKVLLMLSVGVNLKLSTCWEQTCCFSHPLLLYQLIMDSFIMCQIIMFRSHPHLHYWFYDAGHWETECEPGERSWSKVWLKMKVTKNPLQEGYVSETDTPSNAILLFFFYIALQTHLCFPLLNTKTKINVHIHCEKQ